MPTTNNVSLDIVYLKISEQIVNHRLGRQEFNIKWNLDTCTPYLCQQMTLLGYGNT